MSVWKFFAIPASVLSDTRITPAAKLIFGLLRYRQYDKGACWPGIESISKDLGGLSRAAVSRAIGQLEKNSYITVERRHKRTNTYTVSNIRDDTFLRIRLNLAALPGLSAIDKLILAALDYLSANESARAWIHQQTLADRLGCNRSTVHRAMDRLETQGRIEVEHRGGGRRRGNLYQIHSSFFDSIMPHEPEKSVANRGAKDREIKDFKRTTRPTGKIPIKNLSSNPQTRAYCALLRQGIHKKTAIRIIYEQCHPPESIQNAIENALHVEPIRHAQGKRFCIPAYITGSLNHARSEAHEVRLSKLAIENHRQYEKIKRDRAKPRPGQNELLTNPAKRRAWLDQQKRLLGVA